MASIINTNYYYYPMLDFNFDYLIDLKELYLLNCSELVDIDSLSNIESMNKLSLIKCNKIVNIESLKNIISINELDISY